MEVVRAEHLTCRYRRFPWSRGRLALQGASFVVARGELHLLAGANGAGKSTLLQVLAGVVRPASGSVVILGAPPADRSTCGRIAWLPEASDATSRLTVREAVELQAALYAVPQRERRARAAVSLADVGMADLSRRGLATLSKGERRRVALAQVLVSDPELLLLDEPLDGVDPESCELLLDLLSRRCRAGRTVLLSSHLLLERRHGCDMLTILDRGVVVASGPIESVLARPDGGPPYTLAELLRARRVSA